MSRVGKNPISLPKGVEIQTSGDTITVKGAKGQLSSETYQKASLYRN
jgi:large subunit ribosomal protein L6